MTVQRLVGNRAYMGESTDTKPADATVGATFYETDTKEEYIWTGTEWVESGDIGAELEVLELSVAHSLECGNVSITDNTTPHDLPDPSGSYAGFILKANVNTEAITFTPEGSSYSCTINAGLPVKFDVQNSVSPGVVTGVSGNSFTVEIVYLLTADFSGA